MDYDARQLTGSEFGGVERAKATIQPMSTEALTPAQKLRLGYLTGDEADTESLEDHRQFYGLRPASGERPVWLGGTGQKSKAELQFGED